MRSIHFLAFLALISVQLSISGDGQASASSSATTPAEIFYVSFGGDPYSPITRSNIEDRHEQRGRVNLENANFQRLITILSQAPAGRGCFNPKRVRIKIRTPDSILYVDETGAVERLNGLGFLSEENRNLYSGSSLSH
jgi:hypothetical protein